MHVNLCMRETNTFSYNYVNMLLNLETDHVD